MLWHGKNFRGIINKAKQMIFDNTGTNLVSTNAEDAIKEVNSNLANLDKGTYNIMLVMGTQVGSYTRAGYNFIHKETYNVTLNSAMEASTATELKNNFNVSPIQGVAIFYTTQAYAGKLINFNITVS